MIRMAYAQGSQDALHKYAGAAGGLLRSILSSPHLKPALNVAGLSLIAAPTVHSLLSRGEDSPTVKKTKHISDLAGLGMLIGTEFMRH